jgi:hypothetical protein
MEMSKNGNKIAVVDGAARVGCAAMTVAAAAMLTAFTLLAEPLEQTSPDAMIQALQGAFGARHRKFRRLVRGNVLLTVGTLFGRDYPRRCTLLTRWRRP